MGLLALPEDFWGVVRLRQRLLAHGETERGRAEVLAECRANCRFWFDMFAWTFDPRAKEKVRPFVLYPFQRELVEQLNGAIEAPEDLLVEKSRDMGATWLVLGVFVWRWLFRPHSLFRCVSRIEDVVDKAGDPDTLFWKIDALVGRLPSWMRPVLVRQRMILLNRDNKSAITGSATAADATRGGRQTAILLDEFASIERGEELLAATADATPCRLFNSTPKGMGNAFAEVRMGGKCKVVSLHWSKHPAKGAGLYYDAAGKPRSPWYDRECARRVSLREIGQELDIDYQASGSMFFDSDVLARVNSRDVRRPVKVGEMDVFLHPRMDTLSMRGFREGMGKRRLALWTEAADRGCPARDRNYAIGIDVGMGNGASNSVATVGDCMTGEMVAQVAASDMAPHDFAAYVVGLGKWFGGAHGEAYLCWESNGPGILFGRVVRRLNYRNIYWLRREEREHPTRTDVSGWHSNRQTKELLLGQYRAALAKGQFVVRSADSVREAMEYAVYDSGQIGPGKLAQEATGARAAHGDRVIADALCWFAMSQQRQTAPAEHIAPPGSFAARREVALSRGKNDGW